MQAFSQFVQSSYELGVKPILEQVLGIQTVPEATGAVRVQNILGVESVLSSRLLQNAIFSSFDLVTEA